MPPVVALLLFETGECRGEIQVDIIYYVHGRGGVMILPCCLAARGPRTRGLLVAPGAHAYTDVTNSRGSLGAQARLSGRGPALAHAVTSEVRPTRQWYLKFPAGTWRPLARAGPPAALPRGRPRSRPGGSRAPAAVPPPPGPHGPPCRWRPGAGAPGPAVAGQLISGPHALWPGPGPRPPSPADTRGVGPAARGCRPRCRSPALADRGHPQHRRPGRGGAGQGRRPAGRRAWRPLTPA